MIKNKILLIDGFSLLFRAYYGTLKTFETDNNNNLSTNAIYTTIKMLNKFLNENNNYNCIFVFFDKGRQTKKHKKFNNYKLNRPKTPDDLIKQVPLFKEFLKNANIDYFDDPDYEADDLIGTASVIFSKKKYLIDIISSDKDLLQLVDENVSLLMPKNGLKKNTKITINNFNEFFFVKPNQIPDLKGLMGDASDNLPGIKGIGEKTAIKLLSKYETIEEIYKNFENIENKIKKNLLNQEKTAIFFKEMTKLKINIKLKINFTDKEYCFYSDKLNDFYEKYKMNSFLKKSLLKNQRKFKF